MTKRDPLLKSDDWERTQIKVFKRWTEKQLMTRGIKFDDLLVDFQSGVKLIQLLEIVGKESLGKYHPEPKLPVHRRENCVIALKYIEKRGIKLNGICADDILEGNKKLTLGMIWIVINKFMIEEISVEKATARDALLMWCKENTQGYADVNVVNFSSSWAGGLAFCALINKFRPTLLDYNALDRSNQHENCVKAFNACRELGIYVFLDPEDLIGTTPDDKSVITQVAEFFHFLPV